MFAKTNEELKGSTYAADLTALHSEVEMVKEEYSEIVSRLSKAKQHLIALRNERTELEVALLELREADKHNEKDIESLNQHTCPVCSSKLSDTTRLRAIKYNTSDDIIIVSNDIQRSVLEINNKIDSETNKYKELLTALEEYEAKFNMSSAQVNDVLRHKGFIEVRDSLLIELGQLKQALEKIKVDSDALNKKRREYDATKKNINNKYYQLLVSDKQCLVCLRLMIRSLKTSLDVLQQAGAINRSQPLCGILILLNSKTNLIQVRLNSRLFLIVPIMQKRMMSRSMSCSHTY